MIKIPMLIMLTLCYLSSLSQVPPAVSDQLRKVNNDTVAYVKSKIIDQKATFENQPLEALLLTLPKGIVTYFNGVSGKPGVYSALIIHLYTYLERESKILKKEDPLIISISWKVPVTRAELENAGLLWAGGNWNTETLQFFKNRIISRVSMVKYNF